MFLKLSALVAAFAGLLATSFAVAQTAPPPPGKTPANIDLPKVETYSLQNGLKVTLVSFGRAPKATIRTVVRAGRLNDGDTPFIADLTAALMQTGAGGKSAIELAATASAMGGDLETGVDTDEFFVETDVLSESAPAALALIADMVQRPTLAEEQFRRVRLNVLRNLAVAEPHPQHRANAAFYGSLFPEHPYGVVAPKRSGVAALTLDDVKAFHAANFGAQRTHIIIVGRFKAGEVKKAIREQFGAWQAGPAPATRASEGGDAPTVQLVNRTEGRVSSVRLGKRVPTPDGGVALEAADTLLGGNPSSRITRLIRDEKRYAQSLNSFVNAWAMGANWQQDADVLKEETGAAISQMLGEVRRLQEEAPGEGELAQVKSYMIGSFALRLGSRQGVARELAFADRHGLGVEYLESFISRVTALTPADVQAAARAHLAPEAMSLAIVGDLAVIRPQLEALPEIANRLPPLEETVDP